MEGLALDRVRQAITILDIGSGPGYVAKELATRGVNVISCDTHITGLAREFSMKTMEMETCNWELSDMTNDIDFILLLDVIEFNLRGEPIMSTPANAWNTFSNSGIDTLVMENLLIRKG